MDKLKPCPFCGATEEEQDVNVGWVIGDDMWIVSCDNCGACGPEVDSGAGAIEAWNRMASVTDRERTIDVLGVKYMIVEESENDNENLKDCDGYCDWTTKEIVLRQEIRETTTGTLFDLDCYFRKVLRHEIVHAFLIESGLAESSAETTSWAFNEEMVDWIARQGQKIYNAWKEAGALDD